MSKDVGIFEFGVGGAEGIEYDWGSVVGIWYLYAQPQPHETRPARQTQPPPLAFMRSGSRPCHACPPRSKRKRWRTERTGMALNLLSTPVTR